MPVLLDSGPLGRRLFAATAQSRGQPLPTFRADRPNCIEVGLINNMSDTALEQTERQILTLLDASADNLTVSLKLYALPDVPRAELGRKHLGRLHYRTVDELWNSRLDALIITGAEPREPCLTQELFWRTLTKVFDWAERNTLSTVLSCLAVHAAILHFDGINRQQLNRKRFGVFNFDKVSDNQLLRGLPARVQTPHSRWNGISGSILSECGYEILSSALDVGVDTFVKSRNSLFVFFQGHPEYEAWTLFGEYRRDVVRFLSDEQDNYPELPSGYFDGASAELLDEFRQQATNNRRKDLIAKFPADQVIGKLKNTWQQTAITIYRNWLFQVSARKSNRASRTAQ